MQTINADDNQEAVVAAVTVMIPPHIAAYPTPTFFGFVKMSAAAAVVFGSGRALATSHLA
jgi:hypothetical protein